VDYITGRGLDFSKLFPKKTTEYNPRFGSYKEERDFRNRGEGGWITKIYEGKDRLLNKLMEFNTKKDRINYLLMISTQKKLDIKERKSQSIIEDLFYKDDGKTAEKMILKDSFSQTAKPRWDEDFLKLAASFSSIDLSGETDEPVTTDIKRLIRCPGSLHGKTGLKVVEVDMDSIKDFDPLRDAVALGRDPVKVRVVEGAEQSLGGERFSLKEGETEVPLYLAYFLIARRMALLP
ncbi:MAG: hypothetical protein ACMUHB_01720, partial [Thermoplasmatota archaeon]